MVTSRTRTSPWNPPTAKRRPSGEKAQFIAILEVDDVDHWFASTDRPAFFESRGMRATPFRNPAGDGKSVALLVEAPDMETLQSALATPEAAETQVRDGVHVATIRMFIDA